MASKKDNAPTPQPQQGEQEQDEAAESAEETGDEAVSLTPDELNAKIQEAVAAAVKKERAKAKKKAAKAAEVEDDADEDDDDDGEDADEVISKAEARAARAEQEAAAAKKEALLAKVENKLNAYLALNFRDLIGNAPDIMLHIERALTPDAKEGEIARLIEAQSKAFADRVKAARKPASGAPPARNRISGLVGGTSDNPTDRTAAAAATTAQNGAAGYRPFSTINWHG